MGVFGDGPEGSLAVAKSVGEARPPFVLLAVERLLDMGHEPALRCLERLRKRMKQVEEEGSPCFCVTMLVLCIEFFQATDALALNTTSPTPQISNKTKHSKFYDELGECVKRGNLEDSTNRA